uniref:H15 domain-containing protein n=1 Tax=Kalanchoe fedtschenkoi TaxID=63787 RepID=A0A7N0V493_KALFE
MDPYGGFNPFPMPATVSALDLPPPPPLPLQNPIALHQVPLHPEMIKAAIGALNEPNGSSKHAISRYIERAYPNLPPAHPDDLAACLLALKNNGDLLQIKHSFKLSGSAPPPPPPPPPALVPTPAAAAASGGGSSHRKRGRPRKLKPTTEPNFGPNFEPATEANGAPVEPVASPEKSAGRPARVVSWAEEGSNGVGETGEKKSRGRPKRTIKKTVLTGPSGYPKRSPGRPPKSRSVADVFGSPVMTLAIAGARKRGRPKGSLSSGKAAKVLKKTGGRPGKAGSRVLGPAEPQWMVDYAHVRAKFDYIQSKMRKAIGVIKPHLINQSMANGHLGTALQELDQISTMDVMAVSLADRDAAPEATAEPQLY